MNTDALQNSGVCKRGNSGIGESPTMRQRFVEFGNRDSNRRKFRESLPHTVPFLRGRGIQRSRCRKNPGRLNFSIVGLTYFPEEYGPAASLRMG